ncbi:cupin domain-containing protein [Streptomyces sp. NPDC056161]|uniref:cupin domain-containing protein n=1 Tax=Streptomyces sp. NPDC056161 TaxID=3345732 RepID=UPI0035D540D8
MTYLVQPEQQRKLDEWIAGGMFSVLLDKGATGGRLAVGRFDVAKGDAPLFHVHTREDEVFMLIKGTAWVRAGEEEHELREGGIVYLPRNIPHSYRADLLMIATPGGIEGMFRHAGRDLPTPRPEGFEIPKSQPAEASELYGGVIVGPPR